MEEFSPFFDLCISDKCIEQKQFPKIAEKLVESGYKTIAISRFLSEDSLTSQKTQKTKKNDSKSADIVQEPVTVLNPYPENLKILHRLTLIFSDNSTIQKVVKADNFKKYDLFAVIPKSQKALQYACSEVDADIISFDPEINNPIKFNRKLYNLAVERGMYFEIMYAPAICKKQFTKNIITMSHLYHSYGKLKNVIISSWAFNPILIRGPYDLCILLFGLTEEQAKNAISNTCKNLLIRAEGRRYGKVVMIVKTNEDETVISASEEDSDMEAIEIEPAPKKLKEN